MDKQKSCEDIGFAPSRTGTIGVELELLVVESATFQPVPDAGELIRTLRRHRDVGSKAKPEFFSNTLEITTGIATTVPEAVADLESTLAIAHAAARRRGLRLLSAGIHPSIDPSAQSLTRGKRYTELSQEFAGVGRDMVTAGLHVHIGVESGDAAVRAMSALSYTLPLFIALSASSPYWKQYDTGLESQRCIVFGALPHTGLPPRVSTWQEYVQDCATLCAAGAIDSVQSLHYDVRPAPAYGTIELRICDAVPTMREIGAIVALTQCLAAANPPIDFPKLSATALQTNKWRAVRYGKNAHMITGTDGRTLPIGQVINDLVTQLMPTARRLGCTAELADVVAMLHVGSSARRQRAVYASSPRRGQPVRVAGGSVVDGGLLDVAQALVAELETGRVQVRRESTVTEIREVA